jgi:4-amino-4-deoxychorismate lyase
MFIESIRILRNKPQLIAYHNARLNHTIRNHYHNVKKIDLKKVINTSLLEDNSEYKCRVLYNESIIAIEYQPYIRKSIKTLKIVHSQNVINYPYKKVDRPELDVLFSQRGIADEIIIVNPEGFITDAYYYNIIVEKNGVFFTPNSNLLNGVMRSHLLSKGKIHLKKIHIDRLKEYEKIYLVNALNPLGVVKIEIGQVIF